MIASLRTSQRPHIPSAAGGLAGT